MQKLNQGYYFPLIRHRGAGEGREKGPQASPTGGQSVGFLLGLEMMLLWQRIPPSPVHGVRSWGVGGGFLACL